VDSTVGAPEPNEFFRYFVETAQTASAQVVDRCNPTLIAESDYEDRPDYLADHQVKVVASLPCYTAQNVAKQRGPVGPGGPAGWVPPTAIPVVNPLLTWQVPIEWRGAQSSG
jgi:hypothetical protein